MSLIFQLTVLYMRSDKQTEYVKENVLSLQDGSFLAYSAM